MKKMFDTKRNSVLRTHGLARQNRRSRFVWMWWSLLLVLSPAIVAEAYQPGFMLTDLSNLTSAATGRTALGLGTAAVKAASGSGGTVASVTGSFTAGHMITAADTSGTSQDGGAAPTGTVSSVTCGTGLSGGTFTTSGTCAVAPTAPTIYTSTLPVTLAATMNLLEVIEMASPAAGVANLPASPASGMTVCLKDGLKNFAANVLTVKTTDSATIDKVSGATGFAMNQNGQGSCFVYSVTGTNWYVVG